MTHPLCYDTPHPSLLAHDTHLLITYPLPWSPSTSPSLTTTWTSGEWPCLTLCYDTPSMLSHTSLPPHQPLSARPYYTPSHNLPLITHLLINNTPINKYPPLTIINALRCTFGSASTPAVWLDVNTLRCKTPPYRPGTPHTQQASPTLYPPCNSSYLLPPDLLPPLSSPTPFHSHTPLPLHPLSLTHTPLPPLPFTHTPLPSTPFHTQAV